MIKQSRVLGKMRPAFAGQKRCQYLALLGVSLFSVALTQEKTVTAQAAETGSQIETIGKRIASEDKGSLVEKPVVAPVTADVVNTSGSEEQPDKQAPSAPVAGDQEVETENMATKRDTQEDRDVAGSNLANTADAGNKATATSEQIADKDDDNPVPLRETTSVPNQPTPYKNQVTNGTQSTANVTPKKTAKGKVYVRYVTDLGGELLKDVMTGHVGDKFTAESLEFTTGDDKDFMLKDPSRIRGIYGTQAQTVTFTYRVPRVRATSIGEMGIFTITYGDGSLKSVQIIDGGFEINLIKDIQGQPAISVQTIPAGKRAYCSTNNVIDRGKYVGLFNTKKYSYIFEKSYGSDTIQVLKINSETGHLTVQQIAAQTKVDAVARALDIGQDSVFETFWHKLATGRQSYERAPYQSAGKLIAARNLTGNQLKVGGPSEMLARLPQTSEKSTKMTVLGYIGLALSGVMVFLVKRTRRL
ncbi:MucBP domain-containing protein [Levilactobacillus tujiorum]|uniref:MucBP domain-containing protein n=1 Tax=Levilactobacillus tujiorum TaxID=2912243 RepID=UPI001456839E|nr:MucBP domain-containing protein [Levilactobacillus tujiorum]NLR31218.1 MucBP domain-containing protein [Levilactobacillus tujiorum]